jgi:hypothetical protein
MNTCCVGFYLGFYTKPSHSPTQQLQQQAVEAAAAVLVVSASTVL